MATEVTAKVLRLEGELTIYRASEVKDEIADVLQNSRPVEIDLSGVTEIDSAGLQLLIVAKYEARRKGMALCFVAHSPAVLEVMDLANLSSDFGDPVILSAH